MQLFQRPQPFGAARRQRLHLGVVIERHLGLGEIADGRIVAVRNVA
jgi:hypothetical protein